MRTQKTRPIADYLCDLCNEPTGNHLRVLHLYPDNTILCPNCSRKIKEFIDTLRVHEA